MAKELPYFKFEPGAWDNGNIQLCSYDVKGMFIDLCSMYWQRLGELPYKLALQKVCGGNATALKSLCDEDVIAVNGDKIVIKFLDEQLSEFENISNKNAENARSGWQKRKKYATAKRPQSDRNAIRRGEERREDESIYGTMEQAFDDMKKDDIYIEQCLMVLHGRDYKASTEMDVIKYLRLFLSAKAKIPNTTQEIRRHFKNYLHSSKLNGTA